MLPRCHILDIWEFAKEPRALKCMAAGSLIFDAVKYVNLGPHRDHVVDAIDCNEFIVYMYPDLRPNNRSLLFHVVSDLLGLLMYGIPKKRKASIESLEVIDYSNRNLSYPVIGVWNFLKCKVGKKRSTGQSVVDGFISKIRVEMDVLDRFPFVEEVFAASTKLVRQWAPCISRFYEKDKEEILDVYDRWLPGWGPGKTREEVLSMMLDRLALQSSRDYGIEIDKPALMNSILHEKQTNREENERFSHWYREGATRLFEA